MNVAYVVTQWIGDGSYENPMMSELLGSYELKTEDITRQEASQITPSPNAFTIRIECDQSTLDLIAADERFIVLDVE